MDDNLRIAFKFLQYHLQIWGQTVELSEKVKQDYLEAAGYKDDEKGNQWLDEIIKAMPRGRSQQEVKYLYNVLAEQNA